MTRTTTPLTLAVLALAAPPAASQADSAPTPPRSVRDSVYTTAQAARGAEVYRTVCGNCHAPSQFTGPTFARGWHGRRVHELFALIRTTMPLDNPGSLRREQYVDVLAHILRLNGFPAAGRDLPPDDAALKAIVIEAPTDSGTRVP